MNSRDLERKLSFQNRFETPHPIGSKKPKVSIWEKFSELQLETTADKVKFLVTFILIGLALIIIGDLFKLVEFKSAAIALKVVGWLIISAGFFGPIVKLLDQNP